MGYFFRLTARVLLYAPSHRQDSTYHGLCYTSRGEHWLERKIAQWVHPMKDRSDDPSHHDRTLLPRIYTYMEEVVCKDVERSWSPLVTTMFFGPWCTSLTDHIPLKYPTIRIRKKRNRSMIGSKLSKLTHKRGKNSSTGFYCALLFYRECATQRIMFPVSQIL